MSSETLSQKLKGEGARRSGSGKLTSKKAWGPASSHDCHGIPWRAWERDEVAGELQGPFLEYKLGDFAVTQPIYTEDIVGS